MEKREINRMAGWLPGLAAVVVMAGCATQQTPPSDTLAGASASQQSAPAVPPAQPAAAQMPPAPILVAHRYVVRRGDTLTGIASANDCSVADLLLWNKLNARSRLRAGQALRIVKQETPQAPVSTAAANGGTTAASGPQPAADTASNRQVVKETKRHASAVALAWPARGSVVEPFKPGQNRGIQIAGRPGDPVRAAADGRVMYAGTGLNDYGSLIIVQHNADFLTAYAHNRKLLVKTGDVVHKGDEIAEMGDLDNSRVALLFEVRRDGKPVNPMPYLPSSQG
ncbi:peptidoglycan DD-metalloendopeptidase family protein [Burkholderia sp. MR1-5-21]